MIVLIVYMFGDISRWTPLDLPLPPGLSKCKEMGVRSWSNGLIWLGGEYPRITQKCRKFAAPIQFSKRPLWIVCNVKY